MRVRCSQGDDDRKSPGKFEAHGHHASIRGPVGEMPSSGPSDSTSLYHWASDLRGSVRKITIERRLLVL